MSELTKEHFESYMETKLRNFVTKEHFEEYLGNQINGLEGRVVKKISESTEELARMVAHGFEDIQKRLDVREQVNRLEVDVSRVKGILKIA